MAFAVVDVETTGLSPHHHRVLQIAVELVDDGDIRGETWTTLVDPKCDPGPVHIHGITPERLRGAPAFDDVHSIISRMLSNRVFVAHNAAFDWGFLSAELHRSGASAMVAQQLCTMALARRLELNVPNHKLGTLADYYRIRRHRAHDASDDVRVTAEVLRHLLRDAARVGIALPFSRQANSAGASSFPRVESAPRVENPWADPGPWTVGTPLVQGAKFVITGETRTARAELYARSIMAGLAPMNAVSGRVRFVVADASERDSVKYREAAARDLPIIEETAFLGLLNDVAPGQLPSAKAKKPVSTATRGPLARRRVLVLGGSHERAAEVRAAVTQSGGSAAVNLTPSVTSVIELDGAQQDPRWAMAVKAGLELLDPVTLTVVQLPHLEMPATDPVGDTGQVDSLRRGEVRDLPEDVLQLEAFVSWPSSTLASVGVLDVHAFVTDAQHAVVSDEHFVFYNNPSTPEGAVQLNVDTDGEASLSIRLEDLPAAAERIVITATTNDSQLFGDVGAVGFLLTDDIGTTLATGTCDAGTTEQSMILAELYRRGDTWRVRLVGQGYEGGLHELAVSYGVAVDA